MSELKSPKNFDRLDSDQCKERENQYEQVQIQQDSANQSK